MSRAVTPQPPAVGKCAFHGHLFDWLATTSDTDNVGALGLRVSVTMPPEAKPEGVTEHKTWPASTPLTDTPNDASAVDVVQL